MDLYPISFHPIYKERVWGGRRLATLYGKALPMGKLIGESWEISDRPNDVSIIANGPAAGRTLRWLMEHHGGGIVGAGFSPGSRFPLLIKLLDAEEDLSLQVHPPSHAAARLGGESKTEFWYVAAARENACLHAGLKHGITRSDFERHARNGTVASSFHRHTLTAGDAMFLPSGRVHALGAGTVVFEVQENSDTTYRVFDWNRLGLDGKPRELHLEKALEAIAFDDFEPDLIRLPWKMGEIAGTEARVLVDDPLFRIHQIRVHSEAMSQFSTGHRMTIWACIKGRMTLESRAANLELGPGQFGLIPKQLLQHTIFAHGPGEFLKMEYPGLD